MYPIYENKPGAIGYELNSFIQRFETICQEHMKSGHARAFAFIFYDFQDNALSQIVNDSEVFTQLDRLSGTDLSIFYLHKSKRRSVEHFNTNFRSVLGLEETVQPPCIVFFRYEEQRIHQVAVAQLDNANLLLGFHELHCEIERYIKAVPESPQEVSRYLKWVKAVGKFASVEVFRAFLRDILN